MRVNKAAEELAGVAIADSEPRLVGRQITVTLSPLPEKKRVLKFNHPDHEYEDEDDSDDVEDAESDSVEVADADDDDKTVDA